jgi:hypothetical protein
LKLELNTDFLVEHYYNPIILTSEAHKQLFKHIVWVPSEVEFLKKLQENRDKLEKYEWWYFSKIDQTTDDVSIPYYDTREQEFRNFFPDFVFWLKDNALANSHTHCQAAPANAQTKAWQRVCLSNHTTKTTDKPTDEKEHRSDNSTYPKGGVLFSKDSFVVNQTLVFQIKFCGKRGETEKPNE